MEDMLVYTECAKLAKRNQAFFEDIAEEEKIQLVSELYDEVVKRSGLAERELKSGGN